MSLGYRLDPAIALWKVARPIPKVHLRNLWVLLEGDFGRHPPTTLPLTPYHLAIDDPDHGASVNLWHLGHRTMYWSFWLSYHTDSKVPFTKKGMY